MYIFKELVPNLLLHHNKRLMNQMCANNLNRSKAVSFKTFSNKPVFCQHKL